MATTSRLVPVTPLPRADNTVLPHCTRAALGGGGWGGVGWVGVGKNAV